MLCIFFFSSRRRHTRCGRDWSSDVCSSDLSSDADTVEQGWYVLYRKRDMRDIERDLRRRGHKIAIDFDTGGGWADRAVDRPPYQFKPHVKLELSGYVATSIGLIVEKAGPAR